ncbi:MAG: ABC transporter ATP-binding protein [Ilumatobacter sp.]|uniref:ABC transporter ATP-binding protein n=1 Tax=Ilumatobacter sp. TaxID=1967498 RepID=UPI00262B6551|nr:ABC transporter ATP-binding protein [Ilumatobacter sp.]MDJ0769695.1 ABC transporter ATP-binding protein [Ilumatobacter sp.]
MAEILIEKVTKTFGDKVAVDDASLTIHDGEFLVLLGPSGCGKTTLLRAIAGLGMADSGRIAIDGRDITYTRPGDRKISMVFQSYAIFPHMTVRANVGFGLKMRKVDKSEIERRVNSAAELLHIEELLDRRPSDMSGGQRQRVAVARALAMEAQVLLMDEPLSNLDALLRLEMRAELKRLLADINATTVYVTHDQIEALSMGDRVAVMRDGVIQQVDTPTTVYEEPANHFVGGFLGNPPMNFLDGKIASNGTGVEVRVDEHVMHPPAGIGRMLSELGGDHVTLGIRAENIETTAERVDEGFPVRVHVVEPLGSQNLLTVDVGGHQLKVSTHPSFEAVPDQQLWIRFRADQIRWIDPESGMVLYDRTS